MIKKCEYWDCESNIREDHFLCAEHYPLYKENLIDKCASCGKFKDTKYELCLLCRKRMKTKPIPRTLKNAGRSPSEVTNESIADLDADYHVYIMKLNDNNYYVGQTDDLRSRILEHKDGQVTNTAGKSPSLVWFDMATSREHALQLEMHLKEIKNKNPRMFYRLILRFGDLVREIEK